MNATIMITRMAAEHDLELVVTTNGYVLTDPLPGTNLKRSAHSMK